jgi:signal transduction histidine kinase
MTYTDKYDFNLHIKSTLAELTLIDSKFEIRTKVTDIRKYLYNNPKTPGVLIIDNDKLVTLISRQSFFENYSKPYSAEIYSKRNMQFYIENFENLDYVLVLPSNEEIIKALQIKFNTPNHKLEQPVIVKFDNGEYKILDSYQLILAQTYISSLAINALKEANELKSELLNIAAHDLKNPLNIIIGFTKILEEVLINENDDTKEIVQHIKNSSEHMLNLILELLNSTVIESGKIQLKRQVFELSELVSAIVYQNKTLAEKKGQILEFNKDWNEYFYIDGDSLKIRESIENLINNAIKYSPYNSNIIVEITGNSEIVQFKVIDHGPGFTEVDLENIFGKFQRLSAQPTAGENSTGLGLYIAKQIIDLHNGKIWVESQFGKGAAFFIEFQAAEIKNT